MRMGLPSFRWAQDPRRRHQLNKQNAAPAAQHVPARQVRAVFDDRTITVYQAWRAFAGHGVRRMLIAYDRDDVARPGAWEGAGVADGRAEEGGFPVRHRDY
jgi:hypothetical protein